MKFFSVNKFSFLLAVCFCLAYYPLAAQDPVFIADIPNPHDFELFANGGWDGNWYVGYNTCWVQKLAVPPGKYARVFVGAKLGRMKNYQPEGKAPWQKKAYEGEIYMGISSTASWTRDQSFFLTPTSDIPLEPDAENAVDGVGESRWFWREITLKFIRPGEDHYLALWSPTKELDGIAKAPVLAAGWGSKEVNSWLSNDVKGSPPSSPEKAVSTPVTIFEPALALKLVPECAGGPGDCPEAPRVKITKVEDGKSRGKGPVPREIWAFVKGYPIDRAWVELQTDKKEWVKIGKFAWSPPYAFTLLMGEAPVGSDGKIWIRVTANDIFGNSGSSEPQNLLENLSQ